MIYAEKKLNGMRQKIPILEKISFGLGDFAINGMFTFVSSYLLYFYTDSVRLSLETAGVILFLGRMVDAFACIMAGSAVDRVNTRFGKCRPFLMVGLLPMTVLMCVLFFMPNISEAGKLIFGCVIYMAFSLIYAFVNVPYSTMLSLVAPDNSERISFNVYKNIGANMGAVFVTLFTLPLTDILGGSRGHGYFRAALLFAVCFFTGSLLCVCNTRERVLDVQQGDQVKMNNEEKLRLRDSVRIACSNRNWLIFILIQFAGMLYMIIHNQGTFYYTKYYLECENLNTVLLSFTPVLGLICAFIIPQLVKKIGMRKVLIYGHTIVGISLIATYVVGRNIGGAIVCGFFTSLGWNIAAGMIYVMLTELIDWSEKTSGFRPQGFMTSMMTFCMKMGVAAAGYIVPLILERGGYVAGIQADSMTLQAIHLNYIWIPAALAFGMALLSMACHFFEDEARGKDERKEHHV